MATGSGAGGGADSIARPRTSATGGSTGAGAGTPRGARVTGLTGTLTGPTARSGAVAAW
jgi:hypothetical protein